MILLLILLLCPSPPATCPVLRSHFWFKHFPGAIPFDQLLAPSMAKRARKPRPVTSHFEQTELAEKLEPLAKLKQRVLGFSWDGSDYHAGRGKAADVEGLKKHAKVLDIMLGVAPSGFPSQPALRATFFPHAQ